MLHGIILPSKVLFSFKYCVGASTLALRLERVQERPHELRRGHRLRPGDPREGWQRLPAQQRLVEAERPTVRDVRRRRGPALGEAGRAMALHGLVDGRVAATGGGVTPTSFSSHILIPAFKRS